MNKNSKTEGHTKTDLTRQSLVFLLLVALIPAFIVYKFSNEISWQLILHSPIPIFNFLFGDYSVGEFTTLVAIVTYFLSAGILIFLYRNLFPHYKDDI